MKKYIALCTISMIIISCNSNKSTDDTKIGSNNDSITNTTPDSTNPASGNNNIDSKETDLNSIGDLKLGLSQELTIQKIGQPESRSTAEIWGADGWFHQDWMYNNKGITLNMSSEKEKDAMEIFSITITSPCIFKTNKNIGIGSTYNEVMAAYEKDIDKSASDKTSIVIGSVYGGIIIEFKNDKAVKIFVGAAAE